MSTKQLLVAGIALTAAFAGCKKDDAATTVPVATTDTVSGDVSGTWKKGSTHYVNGDVFVAEGKSLIIEEGVTVQMMNGSRPEFIIKGNFYAQGTAASPVRFIASGDAAAYGDQWGGLLAGPTCGEFLLDHVILEQGGAVTTAASASVKAQFFKAEPGNHVPAIWYGGSGKFVVTNSTIRNFNEDGFYIEGGDVIISNNYFYTTGISGGDAINIKSGVFADVAYNVIYSPNTNALKLSNSGDKPRQAYIVGYNNTILNCGWRRPTTKGGSIWIEKLVRADLYNNLLVNNRYGIKRDAGNKEDSRSVIANNYYYGNDETTVRQFQPSAEIVAGTNDVNSATVAANDPKLENYPMGTDVNNSSFNSAWDFHLKAGSPALSGARTGFTRHFSAGMTLNGKSYTSPEPAAYYGALGTK